MIHVKAMPADCTCCGCKTRVKGTGYVIEGRFFYELVCRACMVEIALGILRLLGDGHAVTVAEAALKEDAV